MQEIKYYILKNDKVELKISEWGAELVSLIANNQQYMHDADPKYWGRVSPVLFPIVCKLKDDAYLNENQQVKMSQHGFLRDRKFRKIEQTDHKIVFQYDWNQATDSQLYNFNFSFQLSYQLVDNQIQVKYLVINNEPEKIINFAIGAHPAFKVKSVDEVSLEFPNQTVNSYQFKAGLVDSVEKIQLNTVNLTQELMDRGTLCYSDFTNSELIMMKNNQHYLKFTFPAMKYMAIWSPENKNAPFVCIEPWTSIADSFEQDVQSLELKKDMVSLAPKLTYETGFGIDIYEN